MMRGIRRLVVCAVATGLLTAGVVSASMEVAHADTVVSTCIGASDSTPTAFKCTLQGTVSTPTAMTVSVTDNSSNSTNEDATISYTFTCTDNSGTSPQASGGSTGMTPLTEGLTPLPAEAADGECDVSATVSAPSTDNPQNPFTATLSYTPAGATASPSPSPSPTTSSGAVHPVKGYDGKCLDDKGNSSANRALAVIWSCNSTDQAQNWSFSNDEFIHNGKCLNDQGNGGIRSKVILWTCNGASNEKWSELANGEIRLHSHNNELCLDDPGYSTKNGTQLIVYTCKGSANQKWALP
jgi:Ricin-type beta-trefoil lectin domain